MRVVAVFACLLATSSLAWLTVVSRSASDESPAFDAPSYTNILDTRDAALLEAFRATLNPTIMRECVAEHDRTGRIDLDYLASCGDFDLYADYLRISKFEAVKKFQHVLLHSSSKLEFDHRLAR